MTVAGAAAVTLAAAIAGLAAGCPGPPARPAATSLDRPLGDEDRRLAHGYSELEDDIFTSYDRDEAPEPATGVIDPRIGTIRIGAGPRDVYLGSELARAPSRWPLDVDRAVRTEVRSKRLEVQLALDQSAGWMSDEVSWRIELCGRSAVIPLRITALYAQDGDRWVLVFEHLSFGWAATPEAPRPRQLKAEAASPELRNQLADVLARALLATPHDPAAAAQTGGALVLGPDVRPDAADEWHGRRVLEARWPPGVFDGGRVGLVGRNPDTATVAYWVGNYVAGAARPDGAAGEVHDEIRTRVTHVFEKRWFAAPDGLPTEGKSCGIEDGQAKDAARLRDVAEHCRWMLVQSHMSQPIGDEQLARAVFGNALIATKPLKIECTESAPATAPAAAPRATAVPPAAQSP